MRVQEKQQQLQQLHSWVEESRAQQQLREQSQVQPQTQLQFQPSTQPQPTAQQQEQLLQSQQHQQQQIQTTTQEGYNDSSLQSQQQQNLVASLTRGSSQLQLIIAEQKEIYVRASSLAELSPYFANSSIQKDLNGNNGQRPLMLDDTYENVLEMLRCILPCELNGYELKPVTGNVFIEKNKCTPSNIFSLLTFFRMSVYN